MKTTSARLPAGALLYLCAAPMLTAATLTVTSTADSGPGSLRQAILDSNTSVGTLDTIAFAIPGSGVQTITLTSSLPTITDPVVLDATTQPGYVGQPLVQILPGANIGSGIHVTSGGSTIRGFVMSGFNELIALETGGGNHVEGNYLCTDPSGTLAVGGNAGVFMFESDDSVIGGDTAGARNLISGCSEGMSIATTNGTQILGNFIGIDVTGQFALPNQRGVFLGSTTGTRFGGGGPGEGNVLAAATENGILIMGGSDIAVAGNLIGTDATGTKALGNNFAMEIGTFASDIRIGGSGPGEGNVISGNWIGISLSIVSNVNILGNRMGTDVTELQPVPNRYAAIVLNSESATDVKIGGIGAGEGNLIAYNIGEGVAPGVMEGSGAIRNLGLRAAIRGNQMFANGGYAIDNGGDGLSFNDLGDSDAGPNLGQNFPIILHVTNAAPGMIIEGTLDSTPNTTFDLDFYADRACLPRPNTPLGGLQYLGSDQVTTDDSGSAAFSFEYPYVMDPMPQISATATDPSGNTSELSQRLLIGTSPRSGPPSGGTSVTLTGTHFLPGAIVRVRGFDATDVVVSSEHELTATFPALPAGTIAEVQVLNSDLTNGDILPGWLADFADVPVSNPFYAYVTTLVLNGATAGCGSGNYCVDAPINRAQMAVFLLKGKHGLCYVPPAATGTVFGDVHAGDFAADWIEALAAEGITGGCGSGNYCPVDPVRRDQMAVFLLKAEHGTSYAPPACTAGFFGDVACPSVFADWIQQLFAEQITGGCGGGNYCPLNPSTRGQMAVFITKTFGLQ